MMVTSHMINSVWTHLWKEEVGVRNSIKWSTPVMKQWKNQQRSIDDTRKIGLYIMYVLLREK